jgi:hypothetical protein
VPDILQDKSGVVVAQGSVIHISDEDVGDDNDLGSCWSLKAVSTSSGEVVIKHYSGKRLPILFLGRALNSSPIDLQLDRLAQGHELIEVESFALPASNAEFDPRNLDAEQASLAVEVLEQLGIEYGVAVDWSADGRLGRELMAVFPGLIGLVVVASPHVPATARGEKAQASAPSADFVTSESGTTVLHMPVFDELALQRFANDMESKVEDLNLQPQLWYGG